MMGVVRERGMSRGAKALGGVLAGLAAAVTIYFAIIVPAVVAAARSEWQHDDHRVETNLAKRLDRLENKIDWLIEQRASK